MSKAQLAYQEPLEPLAEDDDLPALREVASVVRVPDAWNAAHPDQGEPRVLSLDAESLFSASLSKTTLLSRDEELTLTREIARARTQIRRVLRQAPRLCRAALAEAGRGVVQPEESFREREAVAILTYAQSRLKDRRPARATGLTRRQLRGVVTALAAALNEYRALRDRMVRSNIRLVSAIARQYHHPTLTFLDFVQEGTLGLLRAIEKYEPGRMVKFSTYASWWIWQQIARTADTQGALIRTPVHWNQLRRQLSREAGALAADDDPTPPEEQVATAQRMDPSRVATMTQSYHFLSLDAPIDDEDERSLESIIAADEPGPQEQLLHDDLRARLAEAITRLPAREAAIVRQRFGMEGEETQTLGEIGDQFGVSRERIRQLESRALKQLREVCTAQGLQEYLN